MCRECCSEKLYIRRNSVLPLVARDSGIWQTPTLDDSDMSSRTVGFILIYLERALMVLEIASEHADVRPASYDVRDVSDVNRVASPIAFSGMEFEHLAGEPSLR